MTKKPAKSYDYICFSDLAYEFDLSDAHKIEKKIKRRLKYYELAIYDQKRVDYIRKLKDDIYVEISLQTKSKYYNKTESGYTDLADFDIKKMNIDFLKKYDKIADSDMNRILNFATYLYYLR